MRRSHFYRALPLASDIANAVDAFYLRHMRARLVVGVHVRLNEERYDSNHAYVPETHSHSWDTMSPLSAFLQVRKMWSGLFDQGYLDEWLVG